VVEQREVGHMQNFTYLVADPEAKVAAVIDPSFDSRSLQEIAKERGWKIELILNTHSHFDHVVDNERLAADTGAKVAAHRLAPTRKDIALDDGETLKVGSLQLRAVHTPGHSPDSVCFVVDTYLFTGDTLFVGECGRCDLPGSDPGAMYESLFQQLGALDGSLTVLPGHDYGPAPSSTLEEQRQTNYVLQPRSKAEFIRFVLS